MRRMTLSGLSFEWFIGQLSPMQPGFWLVVSFVMAGLVGMVASRLLPAHASRWVNMGRWVLIPYLGLLVGGLSPRLLGLSDIDWVAGLGLGVGLIFAIWLLLALVRATLHREVRAEETTADAKIPLARALLEEIVWAGALEFHWVFLRGAVWELLLTLPTPPEVPNYWSIWLASALALPEIFVRHKSTYQRFVFGLLLITTAILFFYTRNFFLCWMLHASAVLLISQRGATPDTVTSQNPV